MPRPGSATFVAERDGEVVGFASVGRSRDEDEREDEGELYAIYVHPTAGIDGIGRALIERGEESMRASATTRRSSGCWRETTRRALLSRRRLGARRRAQGSRTFRGAAVCELRYRKASCGACGSRKKVPAPSTSTPTTMPPQLMGGVLSSTSRQREECRRIDLRAEARPPLPAHASEEKSGSLVDLELQPARSAVGRGHDLDPVLDVTLVDLLDAEEVHRLLALDLALEHGADERSVGARQVADQIDAQAAASERVGGNAERHHRRGSCRRAGGNDRPQPASCCGQRVAELLTSDTSARDVSGDSPGPVRRGRRLQRPGRAASDLDQERVALAAAGADRGEAETAAVAAQLVHHRRRRSGRRRRRSGGRARPRRRSRSHLPRPRRAAASSSRRRTRTPR